MWKGAYDGAQDDALRMGERSGRARVPGAFWTVQAADACFYRGDTALARERRLREHFYGSLAE